MHEKRNRTNPEEECKTRVKIYQINLDRDQAHAAFRSLEEAQKNTGQAGVDASLYDEVFNAELDPKSLEELFIQFNSEWHPLHRGRSMSVSDVVVIEPEGIPYLVGEIKGSSPLGGSFTHRFTDLVEYNLEIENPRVCAAQLILSDQTTRYKTIHIPNLSITEEKEHEKRV